MANGNDIDKLYDAVVQKGLYTKSKEEFLLKYSTDQEIDKLYGVLSDEGLYTKSREEFLAKYPLKKKDESEISSTHSQKPAEPSEEPISTTSDPNPYLQSDVEMQQDVLVDPIVIPQDVDNKETLQLNKVKQFIRKGYDKVKDQDEELTKDLLHKKVVEATGNPWVAEQSVAYFNKLKKDEQILSTESKEEELPPEQQMVFDNIKNAKNRAILGDDFVDKMPDSDVLPNNKIYDDYTNYLKETDLDEFKNYEEGRYSGGGERSYNFYLDALTHQAKLINAKKDAGTLDDELYDANKQMLEIKFKDAIQRFPEYKQELQDRVQRQREIDYSYDEALKNQFSDNFLDRSKAQAVLGYYNVVAPAMSAFMQFGVDVIGSAGRLTAMGQDDEMARGTMNLVDDMDNYFDVERSESIYKLPSDLKGQLFNKGEISTQKILPQTAETLAQMSTLLIGGGGAAQTLEAAGVAPKIAGSTGLFVSSFMSTQNRYYADAKESGMSNDEALAYANTAASLTSLLELASPQKYFNNKMLTTDMSKKAVKDIVNGVSRPEAIAKNFVFVTKEQGKEVMQELSQELGDNATNYVFNNLTDSDLKTSTTGDELAEIVTLTGIVSGIGSTQGIQTGNTMRSEAFYNAMKNPDAFNDLTGRDGIKEEFEQKDLDQAKADVKEYTKIFDALPDTYSEVEKMKLATNELDKRRLVEKRNEAEKIDPIINQPEVDRLNEEIAIVDAEMAENAGIQIVEDDTQDQEQQVQSGVEGGETIIQEEPIQEAGGQEAEAGGVVQEEQVEEAPQEDPYPPTDEGKKQFTIDAVLSGLVVERKPGTTDPREDFGMQVRELNKAINDIKKGKYETAPAKRLIEKMSEYFDQGDIPIIKGTGGTSLRNEGVSIDWMKQEIAKAKQQEQEGLQKPDEPFEMTDEMKDWLEEDDDWDGSGIFNNSNITQKIVEWSGDKMPEADIRGAISKLRENIEAGVPKTKAITNSLEEMKATEWYQELDPEKQKAFDYDYKQALGEDMKGQEKPKTEKKYVRKEERTILKDKIKDIARGAKIGAKQKEESLRDVKKSLVKYVDNVFKEFNVTKAKQKQINNMIAEATPKNIEKTFERIDKMVGVQEEADRKETVRRVKKLLSDRKSVEKKVGKKYKGKVPIAVREYIKNFDASNLDQLSREGIRQVEKDLKNLLSEGAKRTKAAERAIKAGKRRIEAQMFIPLYKGETSTINGQEAISEVLDGHHNVVIEGELIGSKTALNEMLKNNPEASLEGVTVYDKKIQSIEEAKKKSSLGDFVKTWIDPTRRKANLVNRLNVLYSKGGKQVRKLGEDLIERVNEAYFNMNEERQKKMDKYKDDVMAIFNTVKPLPDWMPDFIKSSVAARRLSKIADVIPHKQLENHPPSNDQMVNWYALAMTELGLEGLERTGVDVAMVNDYMNRPENADLKAYAEYLVNDFYPSLRDDYEPTYVHLTNTPFPDNITYYPTYSERTNEMVVDTEGIMDKDFNVNYMKPLAGNLEQRVKHNNKLNLIVGAHEVAMDYVNRMERAKQFVPVGERVNAMFSKNNAPEVISRIGAKDYVDLMDQLSTVITGTSPRKQGLKDNMFVNGVMGLSVFGALAGKLASIPKQITSFTHFSTAKGITLEEWIAGFAPMTPKEIDVYKRIARSNYVKNRFKGRSIDIEANKLIDTNKRSRIMNTISGMTRLGMMTISIGDIGGVLIGGRPLALAVYRQEILNGKTHNEAYEKAYRRFVDESESAQQSTRESETSHLQRDNVGRLFTAFTTSQTQTTNKMIGAARNLLSKSELTEDEIRENLYNLAYYSGANIGFAAVANGFLYELIKNAMGDEDDIEGIKKGAYNTALDNTQSILNGFGEHGVILNFIINSMRGDDWKNTIPVLQEMRYLADGVGGALHLWMTGKEWDDLTDKEKRTIRDASASRSIRKTYERLVKAAEEDTDFVNAVMNYKSKEERQNFKPKDDKIYEILFGKPYYYDDLDPVAKKRYDIKHTAKMKEAERKKKAKRESVKERRGELLR